MKVYITWYGLEMDGIFSSWEKASQYIDDKVTRLHKETGYNFMPDFTIAEEEVR